MRKLFEQILSLSICMVLILSYSIASAAGLENGNTDWARGVASAKGTGHAPDEPGRVKSPGHARTLARQAAILDSYAQLAAHIEGIHITSSATIKDNILQRGNFTSGDVDAIVKNASVVSEDWDGDTYTIILEVPLYGSSGAVARKFYPKNHAKEALPAPLAQVKVNNEYTGLIIDCTEIELEKSMMPTIFDEKNRQIYSYANLDYQAAVKHGVVSYATSTQDAKQAGSNPLVIKAIDENDLNPVISAQDADLLLTANQSTHFLETCAVVLIFNP
ncbi:MAG: hypothetical protein IJ575_08255 [Selenomonadaceae bacterium]|nr:hypothetical protein [Selenomonadaceae bacterium]